MFYFFSLSTILVQINFIRQPPKRNDETNQKIQKKLRKLLHIFSSSDVSYIIWIRKKQTFFITFSLEYNKFFALEISDFRMFSIVFQLINFISSLASHEWWFLLLFFLISFRFHISNRIIFNLVRGLFDWNAFNLNQYYYEY